jgi:hypothetical protein
VNPNFVSRPALEKSIWAMLSKSPHICILQGMGGGGKTEMARHFAQSMRNTCHVFWMNCRTKDAIISDFSKVGSALTGDGAVNSISSTRGALSSRDDWFMVVDNIDDTDTLTYVRDHIIPHRTSGKLFVTGRLSEVASIAPSGYISMPTMKLESTTLLETYMKSKNLSDSVSRKQLVELLGHLPLAIEQAGLFMLHTGNSIDRYIMLYNSASSRIGLLEYKPDAKWSQPILKTFDISFNSVSQDAQLLLYFMAELDLDELTDEFIQDCTNHRAVSSGLELQIDPDFIRGVPLSERYLAILKEQNRRETAFNALTNIALLKRVGWNLIIHPVRDFCLSRL